ncbi:MULTISPECIES: hypothetical protein [Xenorhabdus]|nr:MULTISPECIES: hypothetical protein [Xenorhabdus]
MFQMAYRYIDAGKGREALDVFTKDALHQPTRLKGFIYFDEL